MKSAAWLWIFPEWHPENCIQCNFCSLVCPHATIRPAAMTDEDAKAYPGMKLLPMTGMPGYQFGVTVSPLDCLGCGSCAQVCPGKKGEKALVMKPFDTQLEQQKYFEASYKFADDPAVPAKFKPETVKGSQFKQPLFEFSGACSGCGETPYAKLIDPAFRRSHVHRECDRLLVHLGRFGAVDAVHRE